MCGFGHVVVFHEESAGYKREKKNPSCESGTSKFRAKKGLMILHIADSKKDLIGCEKSVVLNLA